jgi:HD-like signal output (HDOD) protein
MNEKKRILFVDDEPMILQGLQRLLRPMRAEWDLSFVGSGAEALALMAQTPVDVVVSDMRMPGMNGAELLNEVLKRYPRTIRLVLSGHADQDLLQKCVGSTHQYLVKPCDPEALKSTLLRAAALESSLQNESLRKLLTQMDHLPSIPSVYTEIVEKLRDLDTDLNEIGAAIARDLGMTARILKLVNSVFFGLHRQVEGPAEAVAYLGLETVKSLVLSVHAFSQFEGVQVEGFSLQQLWRHSMETAATAKAIAGAQGAERNVRDDSFVAGMLHDVGKLVLACNFPERYRDAVRRAREQPCELWVAEQEVFGANHATAGGYLMGLWGLPVPVAEAITLHHHPEKCPSPVFNPLTAVHGANILVHELPPGGREILPPAVNAAYLARLGLADRLDHWRFRCLAAPGDSVNAAVNE